MKLSNQQKIKLALGVFLLLLGFALRSCDSPPGGQLSPANPKLTYTQLKSELKADRVEYLMLVQSQSQAIVRLRQGTQDYLVDLPSDWRTDAEFQSALRNLESKDNASQLNTPAP